MQSSLSSDGSRLLIEIPLSDRPPLSKSGKSRLAYSTGSFLKLPLQHPTYGQLSVAINVIVPVAPSATSQV